MKKKWSEEDIAILKQFYGKEQGKEIAIRLGRSTNAVAIKANSLGLRGNPSETRRRYHLNDDFFSRHESLLTCYWAGFIAADGNISSRKKANVRIKLKSVDWDHLEKFKRSIESDGNFSKIHQNDYSYCEFSIFSEKIVNDLAWFNITPKKSLTLKPPPLSGPAAMSFIIGYIDGDGCIHLETLKNRSPRLRLCLIGTEAVLTWVKNIFDQIAPFSKDAKVRKIKNSNAYEYHIASKKALYVLNVLKDLTVPKMKRKWKVVDYYNEQIKPMLRGER